MSIDNLVSIIIPTFNREALLKRAIDSVLSQTINNFEILIIDNFSKDNTEMLIKSYNDERIFFFKNKNNGIIANSRNYGIERANGNYIAFLDSDDWWESSKLEKSILALKSFGADLIYHDCYIKGQNLNKRTHCRQVKNPVYNDLVFNGNTLVTSSVVLTRESLENTRFSEITSKSGWEDYDLWIELSKKGLKFQRIKEPLANYWMGQDNFDNPERILLNISSMEKSIFEDFRLTSSKKPWWPYYTKGIAYSNLLEKRKSIRNFSQLFLLSSPFSFKIKALFKILAQIIRINQYKTG